MPKPTEKRAAATGSPLPEIQRLVLTGFMGSGKSTVGVLLAERLGWAFLDLDREIERQDGRTVPQIFSATGSNGGEAHFRRLESAVLATLLGHRNAVIALGGGAPEELANRLLLEQTPRTAIVYLAAPFQTLIQRCAGQAAIAGSIARPILSDLASAECRFHLRRTHYERIASHTLDTSSLTPIETSAAILDLFHEAANYNQLPDLRRSASK